MDWCCCCCFDFTQKDAFGGARAPLLGAPTSDAWQERLGRINDSESARLRPLSCEGHPDEESIGGKCTHIFNDVYILKDHIGKGSTSSCYKCIHRRSGNVLAVKIIDKRRAAIMFSELLNQFRQEVEVLRILSHPHIIRLFEVFESDSNLHVITEYVQGGELFDYLVERPERLLSEAEASGIIRQVAWALAYMHKEGVMHRDLKLENILVSHKPSDDEEYPTIKLIDFGLAKRFSVHAPMIRDPIRVASSSAAAISEDGIGSGESSPTSEMRPTANTFFGTLGYIAPEMMRRRGYTAQVDNWALGVLTYVLLCGIFPFDDDPNSIQTRRGNADYTIKYPPWAKISDSSKDLLKKLLEVNPNRRLTAAKTMVHPWVAGETASKAAVLGTPKLLEELRLNNMYGASSQRDLKMAAASNRAISSHGSGGGGLLQGNDSGTLNGQGAITRGSVSPLALDENTRKALHAVIE